MVIKKTIVLRKGILQNSVLLIFFNIKYKQLLWSLSIQIDIRLQCRQTAVFS